MMSARLSAEPFTEEFPRLLGDRGLSLRAAARLAGVGPGHLSRALRGADGKTPGPQLIERLAVALGLPEDYFPEVREARVLSAVRADAALRDRLYFELHPDRRG